MTREIKPILNDEDLDAALKEINRLWEAKRGTPDSNRLEALAHVVEIYEKKRFPISKPTPEESRRFRREQMGLPPDE